jgi:hypothetical protein
MAVSNLIQIINHQLRDSKRFIAKRSQLSFSTFSEIAIADREEILNETLVS